MLDWVAQHVTEPERQVLAALVARFETAPHALPRVPLDERAPSGTSRTSTPDRETTILAAKMACEQPIDVMYLLHKALRAEAWRAVSIAERLDIGQSLQPFRQAFERWEKTLGFHADREDTSMTPLLPASALARDNEMAHQRLAQRLEEIRTSVREIGDEAVTTRTRRRLFGKVVALRLAQDDHLEEEELVLPIIRERISAAQQLEIALCLLLDPQTEDERWVVAWLMQELTEPECHALAALMARFASIPCHTIDLTVPSQDHQASPRERHGALP